MRTLENYFDDWVYVVPNFDTILKTLLRDEINKWCDENIGIYGLDWNRSWKTPKKSYKSKWCYMFKNEEQAMMFILMWGGEILTPKTFER